MIVTLQIADEVFQNSGISKLFADGVNENTRTLLRRLIEELTDYSFLMTIGHPKGALKFQADGDIKDRCIQQHFIQFATQEPIRDTGRGKGTVIKVIWPAMETAWDSRNIAKGEVITTS